MHEGPESFLLLSADKETERLVTSVVDFSEGVPEL